MKQRMLQLLGATALIALLSGCGENPSGPTTTPNTTDSTPSAEPTTGTTDNNSSSGQNAQEVSIPAGARAASADFPFPVPEGWDEIEAFTEEKVGKSVAQYAAYAYPGDATDAAAHYMALLVSAGYQSGDDIVGGMTNQAAILVEGPVNGVHYRGNITFDSYADGTQRAVIHLYDD